ncbi:MAG: NADH-quinone oxidoreductase subunit M [Myxococcota bacterium]
MSNTSSDVTELVPAPVAHDPPLDVTEPPRVVPVLLLAVVSTGLLGASSLALAPLSALLATPFLGGLLVLLAPVSHRGVLRALTLVTSVVTLVRAWSLLGPFDGSVASLQLVERHPWAPEMGMSYVLGVDGLSFPLVLLTTLVSTVATVASANLGDRPRGFWGCLLLLEAAMLGVFTAQDWFLFYSFWEITLIPLFLLVGVWGGAGRHHAAMSFFLYTLAGSIFMLLAMLAAHDATPGHTFDMAEMAHAARSWPLNFQEMVLLGFLLGFAVKIPVFPLHGWLPLAHVEAPVPVSMLLSAVLLKMGSYGLLRVGVMVPAALDAFAPVLMGLALVNIIYGALMSWRQNDLKSAVAYSSVSHMGFVVLGISAANLTGLVGATMQMLTHGIITAGLFMMVGALYHRTHTRQLTEYGGLGPRVPVLAAFTTVAVLGSMGLPGLAGFVSELHTLVGGFERWGMVAVLACVGVIITGATCIRILARAFMGPANPRLPHLGDANVWEWVGMAPLVLLVVGLGLQPALALDLMSATLGRMAAALNR